MSGRIILEVGSIATNLLRLSSIALSQEIKPVMVVGSFVPNRLLTSSIALLPKIRHRRMEEEFIVLIIHLRVLLIVLSPTISRRLVVGFMVSTICLSPSSTPSFGKIAHRRAISVIPVFPTKLPSPIPTFKVARLKLSPMIMEELIGLTVTSTLIRFL